MALKPTFLALALKPKSLALQPEAITLTLALPSHSLALALLCLALALYLLALLTSLSFWNVDAGIIQFRAGFAHVEALDSLQCGAPTTLEYLQNSKTYLQSSVKVYFPEKKLSSLINKQEDQLHKVTELSTIFNTSVYWYIVVVSCSWWSQLKLVYELSPEQFDCEYQVHWFGCIILMFGNVSAHCLLITG